MKIVVTGGAGFIGSHIVESLVQLGHQVVVYDNFSSGLLDNIRGVECEIIEGDILDSEKLSRAFQGAEVVSHQAAQLEIFRSTDDPLFDVNMNIVGTLNVLEAAKKRGVRHVLNASSACVYGQAHGMTSEKSEARPNWAYGVSKLAAERYGLIYSDSNAPDVTSFRYGIVYGEREWYRRVLTIFVKRALEGKPLVIFGDGDQLRDFVHVSDVVACHNTALMNDKSAGGVYNVGTGVPTSVKCLAEIVVDVSGKKLEILSEQTEQGEYSRLVPGKRRNTAELKSMWLDVSKAKSELGWAPRVILREGIARSYNWAAQNLDRWKEIRYSSALSTSNATGEHFRGCQQIQSELQASY